MYTQINTLKSLEPIAEQFVLDNDRMLYKPFFERAEQFCAANDILIGGKVGIDLLVGAKYTKDSFMWDLYMDRAFAQARALADTLAQVISPHIPADTVALQTNLRNQEFSIYVNARLLFKLYSLEKFRGTNVIQFMAAVARKSYFSEQIIKLIPGEIQLIEIYRDLYSPSKIANWEQDLVNEKIIYDAIATTKVGGGTNCDVWWYEQIDSCADAIETAKTHYDVDVYLDGYRCFTVNEFDALNAQNHRAVIGQTLDEIFPEDDRPRGVKDIQSVEYHMNNKKYPIALLHTNDTYIVLDGAHRIVASYLTGQSIYAAIYHTSNITGSADMDRGCANKIISKMCTNGSICVLVGERTHGSNGRVQLITSNIEETQSRLQKMFPNCTWIQYSVNIPTDFQITKHTFFTRGRDTTPIADVFNSAEFEMIPYVIKGGIRIGNPWVLLRFAFIDIWTLKLVGVNGPSLARKYAFAESVRQQVFNALTDSFQLKNYLGIYMNERVAKKKLIKETGEQFPIYYPAKK